MIAVCSSFPPSAQWLNSVDVVLVLVLGIRVYHIINPHQTHVRPPLPRMVALLAWQMFALIMAGLHYHDASALGRSIIMSLAELQPLKDKNKKSRTRPKLVCGLGV